MRFLPICTAMLLGTALGGCVSPEQHQRLEFRLRKVEADRHACREELDEHKAQVAALTRRVRAKEHAEDSARAEINNLRQLNEELHQSNAELHALIKEQASRALARPAVPASPLPADVDAALQQFADKFRQRVWYDRGRGAVSFANDRLFEPGSDEVRADAYAALYEFAGIAAQTLPAEFEVIVVGHTDDTPITAPETLARHPSNWHLSSHRAIAVKDVLVKAGLPASRLGVMGYGPYRPIGDDRARNRRVEIFLARKGTAQGLAPVQPRP